MTTRAKGSLLRDRLPGEAGDERPLVRPQDRAFPYQDNAVAARRYQVVSRTGKGSGHDTLRNAAIRTLSDREAGHQADCWDTERHVKYDDVALLQASGLACLNCGGHGWTVNNLDPMKLKCEPCQGSGRRA